MKDELPNSVGTILLNSYEIPSEIQQEIIEEADILVGGLNNLPDLLYQKKFKPVGDHFVI